MSKKKQQIDVVIDLLAKWSRTIEFNNMTSTTALQSLAMALVVLVITLNSMRVSAGMPVTV